MNRQYSDYPNISMNPTSIPHEQRFDVKVKRSENLKFNEKTSNIKKIKENRS